MNRSIRLVSLLAVFVTTACQATPAIVDSDPVVRDSMLGALKKLEGRWEGHAGEMALVHEFKVTSQGSVVRETMFPGSDHEMTNMYALDGNSLVMTHYCAGGNQPLMRATELSENRMAFHTEGVTDLEAADEEYMGEMTLVIVDEDRIEQRWTTLVDGKFDHERVFELKRVK